VNVSCPELSTLLENKQPGKAFLDYFGHLRSLVRTAYGSRTWVNPGSSLSVQVLTLATYPQSVRYGQFVIIMDADFSHHRKFIPEMVRIQARLENYDIVTVQDIVGIMQVFTAGFEEEGRL